jgi:hypothetical protein
MPKMLWHALFMLANQHSKQASCRRVFECNLSHLSPFFCNCMDIFSIIGYTVNQIFIKILDTTYFDAQGRQPHAM